MEVVKEELTEDELALRAILSGNAHSGDGPLIDIIPTPANEDDTYKQDVDELPEPATLNDYDRIPVSQFGAAMLRGMRWKEGQAASRKPGKGIVELYLQTSLTWYWREGAGGVRLWVEEEPEAQAARSQVCPTCKGGEGRFR